MDERELDPGYDQLVEAALRSQPLAEAPPGMAAAVLQRLPSQTAGRERRWQVFALALVVVASLAAALLLALRYGLAELASPERLLRLQLEWWYWQQRAALEWEALFGRWPPLEVSAPEVLWWGAALLVVLGGLGLLTAGLGGWTALRSAPRRA